VLAAGDVVGWGEVQQSLHSWGWCICCQHPQLLLLVAAPTDGYVPLGELVLAQIIICVITQHLHCDSHGWCSCCQRRDR
jgi:hypothetical protein